MGWNSANPIFNAVASRVITAHISEADTTNILEALIWELQDMDWDTEDESVELFMSYPAVLQAFRNRGVSIPCKCTCCDHEPKDY
jgi:hypothetical protein